MKYKYAGIVSLLLTLLTAPSVLAENVLETFWLDSNSPNHDDTVGPVNSNTVLKIGVPYRFKVDGTLSIWKTPDTTGKPEIPSGFQISLDGGINWFNPNPLEQQSNPDHAYTFKVMGEGQALQVKFSGLQINENEGQLQIQLYAGRTSLGDGLFAYYPFNGNANDVSGNQQHGVNKGQVQYAQGQFRQAVELKGTTDNDITIPEEDILNFQKSFTMSLWIYRFGEFDVSTQINGSIPDNSNNPGTHLNDLIPDDGSNCFDNYTLAHKPFASGNYQAFDLGNCNDWLGSNATQFLIPQNAWHLVTIVFDKLQQTSKYYLDNEVKGQDYGSKITENYPLAIEGLSETSADSITTYFERAKIDELRLYNRALSECEVKTLYSGKDECFCQFYAVHDEGLNDSQFLGISSETLKPEPLGQLKINHDIEALALHPQTWELYAASGKNTKKPGYLYKVNKITGELIEIGPTGFAEIDGLAFQPINPVDSADEFFASIGNFPAQPQDSTLWGWAQDVGLVTIDTTTGKATLVKEYAGEIEDLTWHSSGTKLYGVENLHRQEDGSVLLWAYDINNNTLSTLCNELTSTLESVAIEALETLPNKSLRDDALIFGIHGQNTMPVGVLDTENCKIVMVNEIGTDYNDIEGIAMTPSCNQ
jgi:hypothetical protein